jgi:ATP-dependent RNA helicase DeaD
LTPTRELALQVSEEIQRIGRYTQVQVTPIYGGAPMGTQIKRLKDGVHIVSGTPGRVLDHIRRKTLKTDDIQLLVLDEADEMLSMGFAEEIDKIIQTLPPKGKRQTLLFSATIPPEIESIAKRHMENPEKISLSTGGISVAEIDHHYYVVSGMARTRDLLRLLLKERPETAIIFCNTREETSNVARFLERNGYDAEAISSDLTQRDRERVMRRMRDKNLRFLVATDIAARGIDISDLSHVINYQFPESPEVYVHRTGRTGRAGKRGVALSLVGPREIGAFYFLKLIYKIRPQERDLQSMEETAILQENERYDQVVKLVTEQQPSPQFMSLAKRLLESSDGERVVGALLQKLLTTTPRREAAREESGPSGPSERRERGERSERRGGRDRFGDRDRGRGRGRDRFADRDREAMQADEANDAAEAAEAENGQVEEGTEAADDGMEAAGTVTDRKRRRRRRRRPGRGGREEGGGFDDRGDAAPAEREERSERSARSSSSDEPKEFWEAWADEKKASRGSDEPRRSERGERGDRGGERGDRDSRREEGQRNRNPEPGTTRLYVNIGKRESATADDIRTLLSEGLGDDAQKLGSVAIRNTHCYVRVPDELVDRVIETVQGKSYKDREVVVERARR